MPTPTEIFNKTLDRNTLERLQAEDAAALQIFRILDGTRAELYTKLRTFEDRIGEGAEARYSAIVLAQTIHEVNLTFAKMDATISPAFRAQLQAGYTQAQRQTYAEVAAFERDTPGFPEVFKPVAPTDAVLQFMDGQNATMTRLNDGLRARVVQELQRVQPNISDAEALAAAGADATRIKEAISRGIVSGDGTLSIARRLAAPIDGEFPRLANNTIMRTVRLGINESFNHGHEEKIRESAKVVPGLGKAWVSALRRSTKICLDLHGQKCGVGESFRIQGQDVARPPAIGAGLRPAFHLCRSRVVPWNPKWPPNPKLDELTTEEKEHFLNGGGKTDKQKGQGPKAIDGAKAALDERAKQLREKLDADKAAKAAKAKAARDKEAAAKKAAEQAAKEAAAKKAAEKLAAERAAKLAAKEVTEKRAAEKLAAERAKEAAEKLAAEKEAAEKLAKIGAAKAGKLPKAPSVLKVGSGDPLGLLDKYGKEAYTAIFGDNATTDGLKNILTPSGTTLENFKIWERRGNISIAGNIVTPDGKHGAHIERTFRKDKGVHHDSFFIEDAYQGLGWSKEIYGKQMAAYRELGMDLVDIYANGTVGKYSWALQGFDYENDFDRERHTKDLKALVKSKGLLTTAEKNKIEALKHSWEFATYRLKDADGNFVLESPTQGMLYNKIKNEPMQLGKHVMLNAPSWDGVLKLAEDSPSWKQFATYNSLIPAPKKRGRPPGSKNKPKVNNYGLSRPESDFRRFAGLADCDVWGLDRYGVSGYDNGQVRALEFYQGSGYRGMNAALRGIEFNGNVGVAALERYADDIERLDGALNEKPLEVPQYVIRGTSFAGLRDTVLANIGGVFEDLAYMSTTVEQRVAENFADIDTWGSDVPKPSPGSLMWRMFLPAGTPAFYLNALENIGEAEILVGRGMRYRILHHEVIDGIDWVTVEGLPYERPE